MRIVTIAGFIAVGVILGGCGGPREDRHASVGFSRIPQADAGGRDQQDIIQGGVRGSLPGEQIVLYAKSGKWWVQPLPGKPFTKIQSDSKWTAATHLGTQYAALLVKPGYQPPGIMDSLPSPGGYVVAVASVPGGHSPPSQVIHFSGYDWRVRDAPSSRGGLNSPYSPKNVFTGPDGALHLLISKIAGRWNCAELSLTRSLGYGTYSFTVRDTSRLDPAAVFGMFTWDYSQADRNSSEVDIEISRWGNSTNDKNAQFTVQPHYIPENVLRFVAPAGVLTHSFRWEPDRMSFRTSLGSAVGNTGRTVAEHVFTSGIPTPAMESVRMNLYVYGHSRVPFEKGAEVVIEKFEYLP